MRTTIFISLIFGFLTTKAQEKPMPDVLAKDSTQMELERQLMYNQLLSGTLESGGLFQIAEFPKFDFNSCILQRYNFNPANFSFGSDPLNSFEFGFSASPFFRNGAVFSSASYKLNEKFSFGGYSFGANSIYSAPLPNQRMNNFDTRGSTLFMQYKVSKNFKIETRINVSQGPGPGF